MFALALVETLDTSHLADLSNGSLASHTCSKDDRKSAWTWGSEFFPRSPSCDQLLGSWA